MSGKSVLIADDDADIVTALTLRCEQLGLDVRVAQDAMTALMMFQIDPPNLVIIDVNMPRGNGLSVCEMLAANTRRRDVPLIVLTGREDVETIARCRRVGAHYVFKHGDVWAQVEPLLRHALCMSAGV